MPLSTPKRPTRVKTSEKELDGLVHQSKFGSRPVDLTQCSAAQLGMKPGTVSMMVLKPGRNVSVAAILVTSKSPGLNSTEVNALKSSVQLIASANWPTELTFSGFV